MLLMNYPHLLLNLPSVKDRIPVKNILIPRKDIDKNII